VTITVDPEVLEFNADGLIPAIVQDSATGAVLMLGWMNRDSLRWTQETGFVHFWSRSRAALWKKGETSGNVLRLVGVSQDCDRDALLVLVEPTGPTCHTGHTSCFDTGSRQRPGFAQLGALWSVIAQRATERPADSYTTSLLDAGVDAAARKVTEEATEVLMAAKDHAGGGPMDPVVAESADLIYHLFVLWAERGVAPQAVMAELKSRTGR